MPVPSVEFTSAGALAGLLVDDLSLLQYPAGELEAGPCQLWLRLREDDRILPHPLTGPASGSRCGGDTVAGQFGELGYTAWFDAVADGYAWQWEVTNLGDRAVSLDVVFTQDVALTPLEEVRRNEYYVSQYLDLSPIQTRHGTALGVRQNMPGSGNPWLGLASLTGTAGWVTDAQQVLGATGGLDLDQDLPGRRWQHEHTLAGLQSPAVVLGPGETARGGFVGVFVAQHLDPTGPEDGRLVEEFVDRGGWREQPPEVTGEVAVATLFAPLVELAALDPGEVEAARLAGGELWLVENGPDGGFWSGFGPDGHIVAGAKEREVLRPHGHVLHHGPSALADADHTAATVWLAGVFCSQLTHGHACDAPAVSLRRSYAGLSQAGGVRIAVGVEGGWQVLGSPSLWLQRDRECVWRYLADELTVQVTSRVGHGGVQLAVECSPATDLLIAIGAGSDGVELDEAGFGDDAALFADGVGRGLPWRCLVVPEAEEVEVRIGVPGAADGPDAVHNWGVPRLVSEAPGVAELAATLPWFGHDAAVHYQVPRGLEQFTGGGWGTRDVCQGPFGLLLATGEHAALRATLLQVFAGQADDGDWPQWFEYLPAAATPGHRPSHGDVVYWPLLALGEYLLATGDTALLDEPVRFVGEARFTDPEPVREHVRRAVERLAARRTADPRLPAYGHGDWNDSLQPARPELAERMCSTWTSVLEVEALRTLAAGLVATDTTLAAKLAALADQTWQAVAEVLLVDGELAGYGVVGADGVDLLVHPRDELTGLRHGSLPVIHAIAAELLDPQQAREHVAVIDEHLAGPHGIYLFDAPVRYDGGRLHTFQRAEAATFWGREIGLMYTHAQLRWIEALTHLGEADRAWAELLKVVPAGVRDRIPGALPRQASCYYSSADAVFTDRYDARERARDLYDPATPFEGGWRVYSSGPGLVLRLVTERMLGVRFRASGVELDPVLPVALDGLEAEIAVPGGGWVRLRYGVTEPGHGLRRVLVDGRSVDGEPLPARYRPGGLLVPPGVITAGAEVDLQVG